MLLLHVHADHTFSPALTRRPHHHDVLRTLIASKGPLALSDIENAVGDLPGLRKKPFRPQSLDFLLTQCTVPTDDEPLCYVEDRGTNDTCQRVSLSRSVNVHVSPHLELDIPCQAS